MSARRMAEAVGSRFSRDKGDRISPHGDALTDTPTTVTEAEEQGVLGMRRETRERLLDRRLNPAELRAMKVLGHGIHRGAIKRLFELWPEAIVSIRYVERHYDGVDGRTTICHITSGDPSVAPFDEVVGYARCRLDLDNFERAYGRRLAFSRALKYVQAAEAVETMQGA